MWTSNAWQKNAKMKTTGELLKDFVEQKLQIENNVKEVVLWLHFRQRQVCFAWHYPQTKSP